MAQTTLPVVRVVVMKSGDADNLRHDKAQKGDDNKCEGEEEAGRGLGDPRVLIPSRNLQLSVYFVKCVTERGFFPKCRNCKIQLNKSRNSVVTKISVIREFSAETAIFGRKLLFWPYFEA